MNASSFPSETFEEVTAHGLDTSEIDDLREWFCYTKPLGRSVKIVAMPAQEGSPIFRYSRPARGNWEHRRG